MTFVLVEFVQAGDFDAKSYKLKSYKWRFFYAKSYKLNFREAFWKCVLVEFVLVETVLVGDPLYIALISTDVANVSITIFKLKMSR